MGANKEHLNHLGILISETEERDSDHLGHCVSKGSGMLSSHWSPKLQSSWRRTFMGKMNGLNNPSGSKRELTVERMPRLVGGLLVGITLNWKVSEFASQ